MALAQFSAGATLTAADLNTIVDMLQGASGSTDAFLFRSSTGNDFIVRLADAAGARKFIVQDSAGVEVYSVNSDGTVTGGTFTPTTLTLPTSASPSQTTEGQIVWDSDDDVATVGTGAATKRIGLTRGAGSSATATAELVYDTTAAVLKVWNGSASTTIADYTWITKSATESVNGSATLQSDDELLFTAVANTDYLVEMELLLTTPAAADWKFAWTLTGMTADMHYNATLASAVWNLFTAEAVASGTEQAVVSDAAFASRIWRGVFVIHSGSTGGTLNFQWAQNSSVGSNTSVLKNSVMRYRRLGAT